jgi:origin recognition complex subunit 2
MFYLRFGFNILLYGVGSKKSLIEKFVKLHLKSEHHIVLLGFHPDFNAKNVNIFFLLVTSATNLTILNS